MLDYLIETVNEGTSLLKIAVGQQLRYEMRLEVFRFAR